MSKKDDAWRKYLEHEKIVAGLLELTVDSSLGKFQKLRLTRMDTRELRFVADDSKGEKAVKRERDGCWRMSWKLPDGQQACAILGIEVQTEMDSVMPVRVAMEDVINYSNQAEEDTERARREREKMKRQRQRKSRESFLYPALPPKPLEMVVTLVIYTGKQAWNTGRSLRKMVKVHPPFSPKDVPGFQFRLLDLRRVPEKKLASCEKNSRSVIKYLKAHDDKEALRELLKGDRDFKRVLVDTARVIQAITGAKFKIPKHKEVINMCKAERELCKEAAQIAATIAEARGEKRGEKRGEEKGIAIYVTRLMHLGINKENIVKALAEDYKLPRVKALTYLQ